METSGTRTVTAAIRDQAGNMGYVTNTVNCSFVTNALVAYNDAGCITNITHQGPGGYTNSLALGWNEQYQLTSVQRSISNVPHSTVSYSYDLLGRRASRTQDGTSEYYAYDGGHVAFDLDDSRRLKRFYAYGPGIDNILFMQKYSTSGSLQATYYYIKDQQNTVLALADTSGNVVESYDYDAWGRVLSVKDTSGNELTSDLGLPISGLGNRYTFQGREIDWSTGLHYFRARWYNSVSGRWLSKDPIGIEGGLNLYAFCKNNPVNFTDPRGEITLVVIIAAVLTISAVVSILGLLQRGGQLMERSIENGRRTADAYEDMLNGKDSNSELDAIKEDLGHIIEDTFELGADMISERILDAPTGL